MRAQSTFQERTQRTKSILHMWCLTENIQWYLTGNSDSVQLWVWNSTTLHGLNSRVSKQPQEAAQREKRKRTGCSSRALLQLGMAGGQKNPLEQSPLWVVTMKGSKRPKTQSRVREQTWQGQDSPKGTRTEPRVTITQVWSCPAFSDPSGYWNTKICFVGSSSTSLWPHSPAPRAECSQFSSTLGCNKVLEVLFLLKNNSSFTGIPWEGRSFGEWRKSLDAANCREKQKKLCVKWKHSPALCKQHGHKHFHTSFTCPPTQYSNVWNIRKDFSCFAGLTKIQVKTVHRK